MTKAIGILLKTGECGRAVLIMTRKIKNSIVNITKIFQVIVGTDNMNRFAVTCKRRIVVGNSF